MVADTSLESRLFSTFSDVFQNSRFEIIPFASVLDKLQYVSDNASLALTCSPNKGIEYTLEMVKTIKERRGNLTVIPHIAARMIRDENHLDTILAQLKTLGIEDIFLPGGDINPAKGDYIAAVDILKTLSNKSHHLTNIGITGYPEGHALISDKVLWDSLIAKSTYANYIVTQMCFEPDTILQWVRRVRQNNVTLPIYIGIPGIVDRKKLLEISLRIGIGQSINFLKKQGGFFKQFFRFKSLKSSAEPIINHLLKASNEEALNIRGFHVYTFYQIEATFLWWHSLTNSKKG